MPLRQTSITPTPGVRPNASWPEAGFGPRSEANMKRPSGRQVEQVGRRIVAELALEPEAAYHLAPVGAGSTTVTSFAERSPHQM